MKALELALTSYLHEVLEADEPFSVFECTKIAPSLGLYERERV